MAGRSYASQFDEVSNNTTRLRGVNSGGVSGRPVRFCKCGRKVVVRISNTHKNPGREFYTCAIPKDDVLNCRYFSWVDEESDMIASDGNRATEDDFWKIQILRKIDILQLEVKGLRKGFKVLCIVHVVFMMLLLIFFLF
ncbi:Zinc finger, GRF-type [Sesbania bispinosa]|nr:Zinc finger, GRF-type [Sesbania bispinosa]